MEGRKALQLSTSLSHFAALLCLCATPAVARDVVSISRDWRFIKGDPAGLMTDLRYDVRPLIEDAGDGKVADARCAGTVPVIVRATGPGHIILHAQGDGLEQASVHLLAKR